MGVLDDFLLGIGDLFHSDIDRTSKIYHVISLQRVMVNHLVDDEIVERFAGVQVVIPLSDSRRKFAFPYGVDLSGHCQLQSGIIIPESLAQQSSLPYTRY